MNEKTELSDEEIEAVTRQQRCEAMCTRFGVAEQCPDCPRRDRAASPSSKSTARLLTGKEAAAISVEVAEQHGDNPWSEWQLIKAVQRKFCEVNGLALASSSTKEDGGGGEHG